MCDRQKAVWFEMWKCIYVNINIMLRLPNKRSIYNATWENMESSHRCHYKSRQVVFMSCVGILRYKVVLDEELFWRTCQRPMDVLMKK